MKDSYSFDRNEAGLEVSYEKHIDAYDRIFERSGLEWYRVESDVGVMGGSGAHEYMAPCPAGENEVALAPGYAANVEVATAEPSAAKVRKTGEPYSEIATPGAKTIEEVATAVELDRSALLKAFPVVADDGRLVLALVRGDHRVNEFKLRSALGQGFRPATDEEIVDQIGPPGFIGPVGTELPVLLDAAVSAQEGAWANGANKADLHLLGVEPGRDFAFEAADIRSVEEGDIVNGEPIRLEAAIEVGNIFKLGTRYSEPLGATFLDEDGAEHPIVMGSYGIGPARIAAAAIEQNADESGIAWPKAIAPWEIELVALGKAGSPELEAAEELYEDLRSLGADVLFDDRDAGPGEKFKDAELLGCPLRITLGKRSLESGLLEVQGRRGLAELDPIELGSGSAEAILETLARLP
jgi:prolyl-tRNA synthetase